LVKASRAAVDTASAASAVNLSCCWCYSGKERARMLGEITMLQQLKHRNIMRLYDWWFDKQHQVSGTM
jgi:hypothetical protein